jgi:MFS transporter, ACS family, hexuronate transporter
VTMAAGDVGQTVLPPIASVLAVAVAWRLGLGFVLPVLCLTAVVIWLTLPEPEPSVDADAESSERLRDVIGELSSPALATMGVILFLFIFVWQTFSAFYPTYLIEQKGLSSTLAGSLFGLFFAVGVVAKPLSGLAYDRIGLRGSLPVVLGGSIVGLALLPFVDSLGGLVVVTILISTMLGSGAITQSYLAEIIPTEIQGTGLGVIRSSASVLGATGPVLFGVIAERGFFDAGYLLLALLIGLGTLLTFRIPRA